MDAAEGKNVIRGRLEALGLKLPPPVSPIANFALAVVTGRLAFVSGQGPQRDGQLAYVGKVDSVVSVDDAPHAAMLTALNCLAALNSELGDLDRVTRVVKLLGMVNSDPMFTRQPEVIDGASNLLTELFGPLGKHARSSIGVAALPMNIPVEIEMIFEIDGGEGLRGHD